MKNRAKPKTQPKVSKKKAAPSAKAGKVKQATVSRHHVSQVCSTTDPFCVAAVGGKYMDGASVKSVALPRHSRGVIGTNGLGVGACLFMPNYSFANFAGPDTISSTNVTWTSVLAASGNPAAVNCRLVSYGIKLRNITSSMTNGGIVRIRGFSPRDLSTIVAGVDPTTYNCDFYEDVPLSACREVAIVGRRVDATSKNFRGVAEINPSSAIAAVVPPGFGVVLVFVEGATASSLVLDFELFFNWEIQLADSDTFQQIATRSPVFNPVVNDVTDIISSSAKNVFLAGTSAVASFVERHALKLLASAVPQLRPFAMLVD